jgi:hypothetical protein
MAAVTTPDEKRISCQQLKTLEGKCPNAWEKMCIFCGLLCKECWECTPCTAFGDPHSEGERNGR